MDYVIRVCGENSVGGLDRLVGPFTSQGAVTWLSTFGFKQVACTIWVRDGTSQISNGVTTFPAMEKETWANLIELDDPGPTKVISPS